MKNLIKLFKKNGIFIDKNQENCFSIYFDKLIETNKLFNLTSIIEEDEVALKHFLDCAIGEKFFSQNAKVVDVGSGAGFPAIPLKIVRPDLEICMVDSLNKRVNFLDECIKLLKFEKMSAIHARIEDFAKQNHEKFDIATARAVAPLNTLVEYMLPLVKVGGSAVIYKSAKLEEELAISQKAISILGGKVEKIETFVLNEPTFDEMVRKILIIKKVAHTPEKYPRPSNKPKTNPL